MQAVGGRRSPVMVLLTLATAGAAALLSTIVAGRTIAGQGNYAVARLVVPGSARVVASDAVALAESPTARSTMLQQLRAAVSREPLDASAIVGLASAEELAGNRERTTRLMQLAVRIDPRNAAARSWLIQRDIRLGRFDQAAFGFDRLIGLVPEARAQSMGALVLLAQVPQAKSAFDIILAARPAWRPNLFEGLLREPGTAAIVRRYQRFVDKLELAPAVAILLREGDVATARALRDRVLSDGASGRNVVDPELTGLTGIAPFSWSQRMVASGAITFSESGAAIFAAPGPATEATGQQLLLLPGHYTLVVKGGLANAEAGPGEFAIGAVLRARVTCDGGARIAELVVDGPSAIRRIGFEVGKDGCASQTLSLVADPAGSLRPVEASIASVNIVRR